MRRRKILIAAGGTGGHLLPAQELAQLLDAEVVFAGHKLDQSPFFQRRLFRYFDIPAAPKAFAKEMVVGFWRALKLLWKEKPDTVVGFGSFHTAPVLLASVLLGKRIVLYEANLTKGKVTRLFGPFAKTVAQFPIKGATLVRLFPWLPKKKWTKEEARREYGLEDRFTVLVFGGSQGAKFLNETMPQVLKDVQVIHLGMEENPYGQKAVVKKFETDMAKAYAAADFAVCRSGAGTIAELIRYEVPSLLIPYPYAYCHQEENAKYLVGLGGAMMLLQKDATEERIVKRMKEANLEMMKLALRSAGRQNRVAFEELV